MFGLFKKPISPTEFGHGVVQFTSGILGSDAGRSLGMRFDNVDASQGWSKFLLANGISVENQSLYFRLFIHSAIQGACTQFDPGLRRQIMEGAMKAFVEKPAEYDFDATYGTLESIYRAQHKFHPQVDPLNNIEAQHSFLPNPNVGVLNAKYLMEHFIIPKMDNSATFIEEFRSYSTTVAGQIAIVRRAMDQILVSFKIAQ